VLSIEYRYPVDSPFPPRYLTTHYTTLLSAAMEQFFEHTERYQELLEESTHRDAPFEYTEVQLTETVTVEDFLVYYWDWKELRAFLTGGVTPKIFWITETGFLVVVDSGNRFPWTYLTSHSIISAKIRATSGQEQTLMLADAGIPSLSRSTNNREVDVFWRAITTSNSTQLTIDNDNSFLPSGPLLSQFLRGSPSLHFLKFYGFHFDEDHCRALATLERKDLEVTLSDCTLDTEYSKGTFIEWFRHNQVLTELEFCSMESDILTALSGNSSVKKLSIFGEKKMYFLLQSLRGNMAIEHLIIILHPEMSDETWSLFFHSLSTHPRIKLVSLRYNLTTERTSLSAESKTTRMNAILQMLRYNTVVHTIELPDELTNEVVYRNSILPRLEMNRSCFELQRQAVKRADPSIRPQLLGRALHVVRYNPNLVFQFLSENVPAFVRTEEEEEDSAIPLQNAPAIASGQKRKAS
jgi:hypothetical protein